MITMTCKVCGHRFEARRRSAKFCSNACRQKNKRGVYAPLIPESPPEVSVASAPPQCEAKVQEAHRLANDFHSMSRTAPYQLRAKFARLAAAISAALEKEGL